ncbi:Signal transduction histidine kinase [Lachnospiraceae bacterium XBB1006]|nr:Signal transduction histidine kinase [Lachnospiraceae bacterium XBB1006]
MVRMIVDAIDDGIVIVDQETGRIEYRNNIAYGILDEEYGSVGKPCGLGLTRACFACRACESGKLYYDMKRGEVYRVTGKSILRNGKEKMVLTYHNITEETKLERETNEQSQVLAAMLNHSELICWEYDFPTHTCFHSDRFTEAFGTEHVISMIPEEIGRLTFVAAEDLGKVEKLYTSLLYGEDRVEEEIRMKFLSGMKRCRVTLSAIYDEQGQREKAVGMIQNVEELRGLEECFNMAAIQNEFSFFIYDVRRDELTLYQDSAEQEKQVFSHYMEHLFTRNTVVHPEDIHFLIEGIERAKHGSKGESQIIRWLDVTTQAYKRMSITFGTSFDVSDEPVKLYGTIRDVSKRERRERIYSSQLAYIESYRKSALAFAEINVSKGKVLNAKSKYSFLRRGIAAHSIEHWVDVICEHISIKTAELTVRKMLDTQSLLNDYEQGKQFLVTSMPLCVSEQNHIWVSLEVSLLLNPATQDVEGFATMKDITSQQVDIEVGKTIMQLEYETVVVIDVGSAKIEKIYGHRDRLFGERLKPGDAYLESAEEILGNMLVTEREKIRDYADIEHVWARLEKEESFTIKFSLVRSREKYHKRVTFMKMDSFYKKMMMVFQDVSDIYNEEYAKQKILKKALKEAKLAENAKIDFLSRMSHDLRTPLNGIIGMTDIALDEVNDEHIKEYLEKIQSSGQLLLSLVNDILDISQLKDNRMRLRLEPYRVQEFLESIERIIGNQCRSKAITYTCDFSELENKTIITDKLRFGQIFMNLLSNAVKYTPEGGSVRFYVRTKPLPKNKLAAEFFVSDTGIGMSEEFVKQAFDAFSQERTNSIDERIGSGLGLSIVKELVELFGGSYEVDSNPGKGTCIKVSLVLELTETVKKQVIDDTNGEIVFVNKRVLVAEDQPLNAKIISKILNKRGIAVDLAENGKQAVETYLSSEAGRYDAILMDVRMPVMDGIEATKQIRLHTERKDVALPIIATTANAFVEDRMMCLEAGMNEHISKPINAKELFTCLSKYLK